MKIYRIIFLALLIVSSSCVNNKSPQNTSTQENTNEKFFFVKEVIQTSNYTYLKVNENMSERWVAVSRMEASKGDKYYYDSALLMNNFHSKELNRDFETIYFLNKVSTISFSMQKKMNAISPEHSGKAEAKQKSKIKLDKNIDEITIAQIFENPSKYANKEIKITGIVVKINKQIMGKNWIHIQDGTNYKGSFDLTVTSQNLPKIDETVTFRGTIILKKDFGAGYFYDVIMENAVLNQ